MQVVVNGESLQLPEGTTLQQLIERLELTGKRIAIEVNLDIVPRSQHASWALQADDRVEIVHAIGGG